MQDPMTQLFAGLFFALAFFLVIVGIVLSASLPDKDKGAKKAEESPKESPGEKLKRKFAEWRYFALSSGERYRPGTFQEFLSCVDRFREHFTTKTTTWFGLSGTSMIHRNFQVIVNSRDPLKFHIGEFSVMFDGILFLFETEADYSLYQDWYLKVQHGRLVPFPGRREAGTWSQ